jgi:hypothetical protein
VAPTGFVERRGKLSDDVLPGWIAAPLLEISRRVISPNAVFQPLSERSLENAVWDAQFPSNTTIRLEPDEPLRLGRA